MTVLPLRGGGKVYLRSDQNALHSFSFFVFFEGTGPREARSFSITFAATTTLQNDLYKILYII